MYRTLVTVTTAHLRQEESKGEERKKQGEEEGKEETIKISSWIGTSSLEGLLEDAYRWRWTHDRRKYPFGFMGVDWLTRFALMRRRERGLPETEWNLFVLFHLLLLVRFLAYDWDFLLEFMPIVLTLTVAILGEVRLWKHLYNQKTFVTTCFYQDFTNNMQYFKEKL